LDEGQVITEDRREGEEAKGVQFWPVVALRHRSV
jgi:hypothetical protein